ncbi:MAG: hypothetical protein HN927_02095 [Candidatus Marinimicrobia bacterium]|jgi:hypothetical protein|nr:hypothetical protein [Candidatus Neomarinimicrobiota bacterium]MBT3947736.1 hypothetical protein [Candidatus Neomarinimicrobiota bacterium]MBT4063844.1 hypothetical protein [Candidatus Neomarinimicrobiota bacterium]MBT4307875.1 hypothetical protein [Candidatus Neomarinimicrobiota bacterium]MBT4452661.1 hypothetical protein [Candidatus Neomarinimicrobiota bacterium]
MTRLIIITAVYTLPNISYACATCYGASDAPATIGMNWAIMTLLGVTGTMLGSVATVMIRLKNRAKKFRTRSKDI